MGSPLCCCDNICEEHYIIAFLKNSFTKLFKPFNTKIVSLKYYNKKEFKKYKVHYKIYHKILFILFTYERDGLGAWD